MSSADKRTHPPKASPAGRETEGMSLRLQVYSPEIAGFTRPPTGGTVRSGGEMSKPGDLS